MRFDIRTDNGVRTILSAENEADIVTDITIYAVDGIPQVEWKSVHTLKWYPWEKFGGIMLKDMVGPGYEQALENLKRVVMFQGE
jgi:hypothetical protein